MADAAPVQTPLTTFAELIWPARAGRRDAVARGVVLTILGACLLTISAKVQVPGPVPMTLQTLAVLALGAMLGWRLALSSVGLYLAEGAAGLPVFANTPPVPAGLAYLAGPTGGFLLGFAVAAGIVGWAAEQGFARRAGMFALILAVADAALLATGLLWLAFAAQVSGHTGIGLARAFEIGVRPFMLGEAVKVALAALALPLALDVLGRLVRR